MQRRGILRAGIAAVAIGAVALAGVTQVIAAPSSSKRSAAAKRQASAFPRPGSNNAITDVEGIQVGQYTRDDAPYLTGTTVVFAPDGAENGVSVPGGWPGGVNTDVLDPTKNPQPSHAIFLSGGSFFGLSAFGGVMRWLEEKGIGLKVGPGPNDVDPLVSGAIVYDLARGGKFTARPTEEFGYRAIDAAKGGPVAQGNVGAGTGTSSSPFKGGIGTASIEYENGLKVGAIIAVNAGSPVDPRTCGLLAHFLELGEEFKGLRLPKERECRKLFPNVAPRARDDEKPAPHPITAIAVVATNAKLDESATSQMASRGADGQVIAIDTIHTLGDGDSVFALSTGKWNQPCTERSCLETVYEGATKTIARAVVHAVLNAKTAGGRTSYCEALPSACKRLRLP